MLPPILVTRLVARHIQLSNILSGCVKSQPCRYYSNRFISKKLRWLSYVEQHKTVSTVSCCLMSQQYASGRQTYTIQQIHFSTTPEDSTQDATQGNNKEKISTGRATRPLIYRKYIKRKTKEKPTEQYFISTDNNFMAVETAMKDYLLDQSDIDKLYTFKRTSPYSSTHHMLKDEEKYLECAYTIEIESVAIEKWGSLKALEKEKKKHDNRGWFRAVFRGPVDNKDETIRVKIKEAFLEDSGSVVLMALTMNLSIAVFKGLLYFWTGSPSMFSEFMHSIVDTFNQLLLAVGRYMSLQKPDAQHPYGYRNHIHIWSILSGVVIFGFGCGFTFYHAITSLAYPVILSQKDLTLSLLVLLGSFVAESASLSYALLEIRKKAIASQMSMWSYVKEGDDPLCNVVLMEDTAGVLGVTICGAAMYASYALGNPLLDAYGSFAISGMIGAVSIFLLKSNIDKLIGRSIPYEDKIKEELEKDRFVHAVWDHKSQDFGDQSRFKSEVVLDARLITRHYLDTEVDIDAMFVKWMSVKTAEDMSIFCEEFGEDFYNQLVAHVDRKERDIKRKFPEIRHIDIEPS